MREYPVGSVCIFVNNNGRLRDEYLGKECTILEGIAERDAQHPDGSRQKLAGYRVEVPWKENKVVAQHENLKLKKLPPDEAFDKFLNKLKKPVEELV
jgi:hypothetical protein